VLGLAGITSLTYAIVEQPEHGWTGGDVVVTFVAGLVLMGVFIAWETRSRSPLVDLRIFLKGRFTWSTLAFTTVGFVMSGVLFGLSQYIQIIQGNDAMGTGLRMLPMVAALMLGSLASTRLTARWGSKVIVAGGLVVTAVGMTLLSLASASSGYGLIAIALTVGGLGIGVAMPAAVDAMMGALPRAQMGVGMGLSSTLRQLGSVLGVAVLGSILSGGYRDGLIGHLTGLTSSLQNATEGSLAGAAAVARHLSTATGGTLQRAAYDAYTGGMSDMMLVCAGVALAGALLILLLLPARAPAVDAVAPGPGDAHGSAASLEVVVATAAEA
jgi:Na+/melibiose symporter-like transporter